MERTYRNNGQFRHFRHENFEEVRVVFDPDEQLDQVTSMLPPPPPTVFYLVFQAMMAITRSDRMIDVTTASLTIDVEFAQ